MMRHKIYREYRRFFKNERGLSLIEVLVALAIMAIVSVAYLSAVQTLAITNPIDEELVTATRLARSQMESVKMEGYKINKIYTPIPTETGYYIEPVNAIRYNPEVIGEAPGEGMHMITVKVHKGADASGELLITLEGLIRQ
jgi:prepilin-type N-terminal cleavage/methylation domain-containing protein